MRGAVAGALTLSAQRIVTHRAAVEERGDLAALKQMRVGTRRLRAALQLFRPALEAEWAEPRRSALRSLAERLGRVRDADVLAHRLRDGAAMSPIAPSSSAVEALVATVERERNVALTALRSDLAGGRWRDLLDTLEPAMAAPPVLAGVDDLPVAWEVRGLVDRRWRRLRRQARTLAVPASDDELHQLRISVKRCRYAIVATDSYMGANAEPWSSALADLQDILGEHHDAVVTGLWCSEHCSGESDQAAGMLAVVECYRARAAAARWASAWREVEKRARWRWL